VANHSGGCDRDADGTDLDRLPDAVTVHAATITFPRLSNLIDTHTGVVSC
jgi:hypothetical protein